MNSECLTYMFKGKIFDDIALHYATNADNMRLLHLFNPSQEIALADNSTSFTPKRMVRMMEEQMWNFPIWYADKNDLILKFDNQIVDIKGNTVDYIPDNTIPLPWGWNKAVRQRFIKLGIDSKLMPDESYIDSLRIMASRKFCANYIHKLIPCFNNMENIVGQNMTFVDDISYLQEMKPDELIFKQLWSSSGRGNFVANPKDADAAKRLQRNVAKQGGFVADVFYNKILDFAMEFYVYHNGEVEFLGYSVFKTEANGKYEGNMIKEQAELRNIIISQLGDHNLLDSIKTAHLNLIKKYISGRYVGFIGVDMMVVDLDGKRACHPCVEINLRMNMGIVAMNAYQRLRRDLEVGIGGIGDSELGACLRSSTRSFDEVMRERGFHTSLKSCLISIKYS